MHKTFSTQKIYFANYEILKHEAKTVSYFSFSQRYREILQQLQAENDQREIAKYFPAEGTARVTCSVAKTKKSSSSSCESKTSMDRKRRIISNSSSSKKIKTVSEIEVFQSNRIIKQEKSYSEFLHEKSNLTSVPDVVITVNEDIQEESVDNFISDDQWLMGHHIDLAVDFIEKNAALKESPEINKIFILNDSNVHWILLTNINPELLSYSTAYDDYNEKMDQE
ncbi:unnamed protein product [Brachionus calyciflorus]|uniref:Uncharacterized protein n=1 Tax=Brachionus calyciflorus TaxID=104777 RepID=A0A814CZS5_9BILA|nr:unnamed protein product [Brachionus calyciflorus]